MRATLTFIAIIMCGVFLFTSHSYWKQKTDVSSYAKEIVLDPSSSATEPQAEPEADLSTIFALAENWPEQAQQQLNDKLAEGETFQVAIVGSQSLGGESGWAALLKAAILESYGQEYVNVSIFEQSLTSKEFYEGVYGEEVVASQPDLVLLEPFNLNDNGILTVEENHESTLSFIDSLKRANEQATIILQPPHPIFNATIYPKQIEDLKAFAAEQQFEYLDHWPKWPAVEDEELTLNLTADQSAPNDKGHQLWFAFLEDYFIQQ